MDDDGNVREQIFHNAVRENIVSLLIFITLYVGAYFAVFSFKKRADCEELYCGDDEDASVYRVSVWCCTFALATSAAAVLLLPFSVLSNEVLILYPNSYYTQWLNTSLVHGLWNRVFLFSNLSLFILMPFTHFLSESSGFKGSTKGLLGRIKETAVMLLLLAVLVMGLFWVASATLGSSAPSQKTIFDTWYSYLPYLDSWISLLGVLLLLVCTPVGFARLFTVASKLVIKPHFLRNLNEELYSLKFTEDSLRRKVLDHLPQIRVVHYDAARQIGEDLGKKTMLGLLLETEKARKDLERKMETSSFKRNLGYPLVMLLLFSLTVLSVVMVGLHSLELFVGRSSLPGMEHDVTLGAVSFSAFGLVGVIFQVILIFYILVASLAGLYGLPVFTRLEPKLRDTAMTKMTANCTVLIVLSTALPILCRTLGITRFDLLGDFGRLDWLNNFYLIMSYNLLFVTATLVCLVDKFKLSVCNEMYRKLAGLFLRSRSRHTMSSSTATGRPTVPEVFSTRLGTVPHHSKQA